jgi:hypothetical protein
LRGRGYDGAHDSVHRFVKAWRADRARLPAQAFIPLRFDPGEAYQFDCLQRAKGAARQSDLTESDPTSQAISHRGAPKAPLRAL